MTEAALDPGVLSADEAPAMVSVRYLLHALRRRRRSLVVALVAGLLLGGVLRVVLPSAPAAQTTLLLDHPAGSDPTHAMATDASMLTTRSVARTVIQRLHLHMTSDAFVASVKVTVVTDRVMSVRVSAPSANEAVRRAAALGEAFLAFRAAQFQQQTEVAAQARAQQVKALRAQIAALTAQINSTSGKTSDGSSTNDLVDQRAQASDQVTQLEQAGDAERVQTDSVANASYVLDSPLPVHVSVIKTAVVSALTGGIAALFLVALIVVVGAALSDRVRRRSDVAWLVAAPVRASVPRVRRARRVSAAALHGTLKRPDTRLTPAVDALSAALAVGPGGKPALVVASVGAHRDAAAAVTVWLASLRAAGRNVLAVDLSADGALARAAGIRGVGLRSWPHRELGTTVTVARPATGLAVPAALRSTDPDGPGADLAEAWVAADDVVCFAAVDPAYGADHLAAWSRAAVIAVAAGDASAERIHTTAELLRAAGLQIRSALLFDTDPQDDSLGHDPAAPFLGAT